MAQVDTFLMQHREMGVMVRSLKDSLHPQDGLENRADAIRSELSRFVGTLKVHLAMEDNKLYPTLANDDRADVAALAQRYAREMLPMAEAVKEHSTRWQIKAIREDVSGFVTTTNALLERLGERMAREETELYPMLR